MAIFREERDYERSEAIPGASRLRNQNEILIEKSDEAMNTKIKKSSFLVFFALTLESTSSSLML